MSNQRSFVLLITLAVIGFYLYYESTIKKNQNASPVAETSHVQSIKNLKMSHGRRLSIVNTENFQPQSGEQALHHISESNNKHAIGTPRFLKRTKRLKRHINNEDSLNWELRVNVSKVKESSKSYDDFKFENSLSMAIYLSGEGPRESSEFQHARNVVEDSIKKLFGDSSKVRRDFVKINGQTVTDEISIVEGKQNDSNSAGIEAKLLTSFFNFGGNQDNPPLEGSGEILSKQESQSELMQDLSFITIKEDLKDPKSTKIFSDNQEFEDFNTANVSLDPLNRDIPTLQISNSHEVITVTDISTVDENYEIIEFCMNMLSNYKKSPRFLEISDEGSGEAFSMNTSTEVFQVIETTTELSKLGESPELQKGFFDRIWNNLPNFGFRNKRTIGNNLGNLSDSLSLVNMTKIGSNISNGLINSFGSNISGDNLGNITNSFSLINLTKISSDISDSLANFTKMGSEISNDFINGFISNRSSESGNSVEALYGTSIEECENILRKVNIKSGFNTEAIRENSNNESNAIDSILIEKVFISHNSVGNDSNDIQQNSLGINETALAPTFKATTSKTSHELNLKTVTVPENRLTDINIEKSKFESITEKFSDSTDIVLNENRQNINEVLNGDFTSTFKNSVAFEHPHNFQTTKTGRFFDNINGEEVLELGSSDERSIFEGLFGSGREELKVSNFNQETTTSLDKNKRVFNENLLNLGSGFSELSETDSKNGFNSDLQNRSFGIFNVGSGERSLNEIDTTNTLEFTQPYSKLSNSDILIQQNKLHRFETTTAREPFNMLNSLSNKDDIHEDIRMKDNISSNTASDFNLNLMKITEIPLNLDNKIEKSFQEHTFPTRSEILPLSRQNAGKRQRRIDIDVTEYFQEPEPFTRSESLSSKGEIVSIALQTDSPNFKESSDSIADSKPEEITEVSQEILTEIPPDELVNLFNFRNIIINNATESIPSTTIAIDVKTMSKDHKLVSENPINLNKHITTGNIDLNKMVTTVSTAQIKSTFSSVTQTSTVKHLLSTNPKAKILITKDCRSARECNVSLSERCISKDKKRICGCSRAFVRNPESGRCEAAIIMQTSVKLPREQFHRDLKNQNSKLFIKKRGEAIETMWSLLGKKPKVFASVAEVHVDKFEEGSLVVKWNIKIVNEQNETVHKLAEIINNDLKELLENDFPADIPLDLHNASASSLIVNPCTVDDLNYCDENAKCILDEKAGFRCECREGYSDVSDDYSGEVCKAFCEEDFCRGHGQCQLKADGQKYCLCTGWYFGKNCEWSGTIAIAGVGAVNFLILFAIILTVFICRKRRRHYSGNLSNFQSTASGSVRAGRITDSIALDEVGPGKVSKSLNLSTPMLSTLPFIQVTSPSMPSNPGSSFDCDSTFDKSICFSEDSKKENV